MNGAPDRGSISHSAARGIALNCTRIGLRSLTEGNVHGLSGGECGQWSGTDQDRVPFPATAALFEHPHGVPRRLHVLPVRNRAMSEIEVSWASSWAWGLTLIVVTIAAHALVIVMAARMLQRAGRRGYQGHAFRHPIVIPVALVCVVGLALAVLHGLEAALWALAYLWVGALSTLRHAMLYSVDSITTRGASGVLLAPHWSMMGALEAENGVLLFGMSTAFMFAVIQEILLIVGRFEQTYPPKGKLPRDWD